MPPKLTKIQRREEAAREALSKLTPAQRAAVLAPEATRDNKASRRRQAQRRRTAFSMSPEISSGLPPDVLRYIRSLFDDVLLMDINLPSFNYLGGHSQFSYRAMFQLTAGTSLTSGVIFNPYMLWTNQMAVDRVTNNATVVTYAPTCLTTAAATANGQVFSANQTAVACSGYYPTDASTAYAGYVRCLGVRCRVTYTGTELNKGGEIIVLHNPQHMGLAAYNEGATSSGASCVSMVPEPSVNLTRFDDAVSVHRIGDAFSFVWRPNTLEFKDVRSCLPIAEATLASINQANQEVVTDGYLMTTDAAYAQSERGWVGGFVLLPAAGTTATALPYWCELEVVYDINLHTTEGGNGTACFRSVRSAHSDPVTQAHIQNALAHVHHRRSIHSVPIEAKSLATKAEQYVGKFGRKAVTGVLEGLGARLAAAL